MRYIQLIQICHIFICQMDAEAVERINEVFFLGAADDRCSNSLGKLPCQADVGHRYAMFLSQFIDSFCDLSVMCFHRIVSGSFLTVQHVTGRIDVPVFPGQSSGCIRGKRGAGNAELLNAAETYGQKIGLAFQIRDDVLDVTADAAELGKPIGSDKESGKVTYADLLGVEKCGELVRECAEEAIAAITAHDADGFLSTLARSLSERRK